MLTSGQRAALVTVSVVFGLGCAAAVWIAFDAMRSDASSPQNISVAGEAPAETAQAAAPPMQPVTSSVEAAPDPPPVKVKRAREPYDLKGDRLGMMLDDFKAKYHRQVPEAFHEVIPWCSDFRPARDRELDPNISLFEETWHPKAGIINARISFPLEDMRTSKHSPTLAGVAVTNHCYSFIDGELYSIMLIFPQSGFDDVLDAMVATYGKPKSFKNNLVQNRMGATFSNTECIWDNGVSTIKLEERFGDLDTSWVVFRHTALSETAESRRPKPHL